MRNLHLLVSGNCMRTTAAFNMDNVLDKVDFRLGDFSTGSWGAPRSFRLTLAVEL